MRNTTLVTSYIQAALFLSLGIRCVASWQASRDKLSGHLALATGFFGINSMMGAISTTVWNTTAGEVAPRWWGIMTTTIIYLAILGFLVFLADFIHFPVALKGIVVAVTAFNIILAFIEQAEFTIKLTATGIERVPVPGVSNLIPYRGYLWYVISYLAVAFGVLGLSFLVYGMRVAGLARFRMVTIGSGFTILFIVIGLIPLLIFGNPTKATYQNVLNVLRYLALVSAPLLFVGFAPPKVMVKRFGRKATAEAG